MTPQSIPLFLNKRRYALTVLMLSALHWLVPWASACRFDALSPGEYLERADLVFTGRVAKVDVTISQGATIGQFEILTAWKWDDRLGDPRSVVEVHTSGGSCGAAFIEGQDFLVFALYDDDKGAFVTHLPDGTTWMQQTTDTNMLAALGDPVVAFYPGVDPSPLKGVHVTHDLKWIRPLGLVLMSHYPDWLHSMDLGWFHGVDASDSLWLWNGEIDWAYTDLASYPHAFSLEHGWIYCGGIWNLSRWYYVYDDGSWMAFALP